MTHLTSHASLADALADIITPAAADTPPAPNHATIMSRHGDATIETVTNPDGVTTLEAIRLYEQAGTPLSERSIQRYCLNGRLTATRSYDSNGMFYYLIDRGSIAADIDRLKTAQGPDRLPPKPPAFNASTFAARTDRHHAEQTSQLSLVAGRSSAMVAQLQIQLQQIDGERAVLRDQLTKKDDQIAALNMQAAASSRTIDLLNTLLDKAARFFPSA